MATNPVRLASDMTRDITLPAASLTSISGTVAGLSSLPTTNLKRIVFNTMDNAVLTALPLENDGTYGGKLAPGSYRVSLYMDSAYFSADRIQGPLTVFKFGAVNVGSGPVVANFTLPPFASLSGRLNATNVSMASIYAWDRSAPTAAFEACGYFPAINGSEADSSGQYRLMLVKDRAYDIQVVQPVMRCWGAYFGTVRYPVPASVVNLSSDSRLDITMPDLPGGVSISGKVTDSAGRGIGNVEIEVVSQSLTGAPAVQLSHWEYTDADGNYTVPVLSGTNYRLTFYPPVPAP